MRLFLQATYFRFYNKFVFAPRKRTLKTKEEHEEKTFEQAYAPRGCCLFVKIRDPSFPGHAPGKDTLRAANAATKEGANGGENGLSEAITRCRPRQNKDSRRVGGHAPPQRHLERSAATTKTRFTGRKQNKRKRILLSSRHILYISSVLFIPSKSRHLPTTFFTAAVSATRNAFVLSSAFMTGQSW